MIHRSFFDAVRLLTLLPAPASRLPFRPALLFWFPVVGALVGLILAGLDIGLLKLSPRVQLVLGPVVLAALWLLLTRGLHIDGLADTFDALGAVGDRVRRLEIMRDPHIGAMGAAAVALAVMTKIWAMSEMPASIRPSALIVAAVCARWMGALACFAFKYAREDGLGAAFIGRAEWPHVLVTSVVSVLIVFFLIHAFPLWLLFALSAGWAVAALSNKALGGITGDVLGAIIEITECAVLLAFSVRA